MSRISLTLPDPAIEATFGWDRPLQTLFGQVLRHAPDVPCTDEECYALKHLGDHNRSDCQDPEMLRWTGYDWHQHLDVASLRKAMGEWEKLITDEVQSALEDHQRRDAGNEIMQLDGRP